MRKKWNEKDSQKSLDEVLANGSWAIYNEERIAEQKRLERIKKLL